MMPNNKLSLKRSKPVNKNAINNSYLYQKKRMCYDKYAQQKMELLSSAQEDSETSDSDEDFDTDIEDSILQPVSTIKDDLSTEELKNNWIFLQKFICNYAGKTTTPDGRNIVSLSNIDDKDNEILSKFSKFNALLKHPFLNCGKTKKNKWLCIFLHKKNSQYKYNVDLKAIITNYIVNQKELNNCNFLSNDYTFSLNDVSLANIFAHLSIIVTLYSQYCAIENVNGIIGFENCNLYKNYMKNLKHFPLLFKIIHRNVFVTFY